MKMHLMLSFLFFTACCALLAEDKKPPTTPIELMKWLPGTMWEIHSITHQRPGEGYLMFRDDGTVLHLDPDGRMSEVKNWGVSPKMLVLWGASKLRIIQFGEKFTTFIDSRDGTSGKRVSDAALRKRFEALPVESNKPEGI